MTDFDRFKRSCERWKTKFGLSDWRLLFKQVKNESSSPIARVFSDVEARVATIEWHSSVSVSDVYRIDEVAKHELLHVMLADWGHIIALLASNSHSAAMREEHRLITRLMVVIA